MAKWKVQVNYSQFGFADDEFDDNMGFGHSSETVTVVADTEEDAKLKAMAMVKGKQETKHRDIPDIHHSSEVKKIEKIN